MKMNLQDLRDSIKALFDKSEDKDVIKAYATVEGKMDDLQKDLDKQETERVQLLKDLKEAYIHTSVKPSNAAANQDVANVGFDSDAKFNEIFNQEK